MRNGEKDGESEEFQWDSQTKDLKIPLYRGFSHPIDCVSHRENRFFPMVQREIEE
jgi:hypothetical protein